MIRLSVVFLCIFFTGTFAKANDLLLPEEELLARAYDGDIAGLEAAFEDAHRLNIAGDVTADELRVFVSLLTLTDPKVLETSANWLVEMPESPYAAITVSWQWYQMSWSMRGGHTLQYTHEAAQTEFRNMQHYALELALQSYETAPDYIAASDALLRLQLATKFMWDAETDELIADVMRLQPNLGTLLRATNLVSENWGGRDLRFLEGLCQKYMSGDQTFNGLHQADKFNSDTCLTLLIEYSGHSQLMQTSYFDPEIIDALSPNDYARLLMIAKTGDAENLQYVLDFLWAEQEKSLDTIQLANAYYEGFDVSHEDQEKLNIFIAEWVMNWVPAALEKDPFNLGLLSLLEGKHTTWHWPWTEPSPYWQTGEKVRMIHARRLYMSPYNGFWWVGLANTFEDKMNPILPKDLEDIYANAVILSNYSPDVLFDLTLNRIGANRAYLGAAASKIDDEFIEGYDYLSVAPSLLCPVVRVNRLQELLCKSNPRYFTSHCEQAHQPIQDRLFVLQIAERFDLCEAERNGRWEELEYLYKDVDLSPYLDYDLPEFVDASLNDTF